MNDPIYVIARLNCRLMPEDREFYFGDPLDAKLREAQLGEVSGGGTLTNPAGKILHIDLEIELEDITSDTVGLITST